MAIPGINFKTVAICIIIFREWLFQYLFSKMWLKALRKPAKKGKT